MGKKADKLEKEIRVYQISLLLTRKPIKYIVEYVRQKWGIEKAQTYRYIRLARKEWDKYFSQVKKWGMAYHINKRKELRDKAIEAGDYRLALEIDRDEAKLLGVYPAEKHKIDETKKIIVIGKEEEAGEIEEDNAGNNN